MSEEENVLTAICVLNLFVFVFTRFRLESLVSIPSVVEGNINNRNMNIL